MNWEAWKPLATLIFTSTLKFVGGLLVAHGLATNGPGLEALGGAATTAAGAFWSWWVQKGHIQAGDYLKKLTDTATQAAAIEVAKRMPLASVTGAAAPAKAEAKAIEPAVMAKDAAKAVVILLALFLGTLALPGGAHAQTGLKPLKPLTFNLGNDLGITKPAPTSAVGAMPSIDPQVLIQKVLALAAPDLVYAVALAKSANTTSSTVRLQCLVAIQNLNAQASGANLKDASGNALSPPAEPHIFTDLEQVAEGIDSLSPTGPLFTSCAGAAALAGMNVLAFINAAVAGTAAMAIVVPK